MSDRVHPELIWAYSFDDVKIGPIHLTYDIEKTFTLQGEEVLSWSMLSDDPKLAWVGIDQLVEYDGMMWRVMREEDVRTESVISVQFHAHALWYDLADDVRPGSYIVEVETVLSGLEQILEDTSWSVGSATTLGGNYSYEATNFSVLSLIRGWAAITDKEVVFDTINKTVSFVDAVGDIRGIGFRYGRNLPQVRRTYEAPVATRMYPFGANSLNISQVNGGLEYVENFDWYTDQGLTLEEARTRFSKTVVWEDDRYLLALNLMDAAVLKLETLSKPTISYECTVMDLSALTGLDDDTFGIGDEVRVDDSTFGINIRTRVVRMIMRPYEPWNNEVELSYLKPGITSDLLNTVTNTGSDNSGQFRMLVDESASGTVTASQVQVCSLDVTTSGQANGIIGGLFVGTGVSSGTLVVKIIVDAIQVGTDIVKTFTNGQEIEVGVPTWFANLESGNHTITLVAQVTAGAASVNFVDFSSRLYVLMQGLVGGGLSGGGNPYITLTDEVYDPPYDYPTEAEDVDLLNDVPDLNLTDTVSDETEEPTEASGHPDVDIT